MSRLKLFRPSETISSDSLSFHDREPVVLSFQKFVRSEPNGRLSNSRQETIARAQSIKSNNHCPHCRHPDVEPLELNDALLSRNNLPVPGTATLVGFRCHGCNAEWPV